MGYDVFISYSHGDDDLLSERIQEALTKFAKPWYRRRALNVFRDRTALSANPGLWSSIAESIDNSRYFLFLASPDAAASLWCSREVEHWRATHGSDGILVLLTHGDIVWDEAANEFDWSRTTALGEPFAGAFKEEPFFVDMRWARSETQLDLTDGRFRSQVADLAAPVHGMAKDELASEDVKQHRRAMRLAISAAIALAVLTVAAVVMSFFAVSNASAARRNAARARAAQSRAEANLAEAIRQRKAKEHQTLLAQQNEKEAKKQTRRANKQTGIATQKTKDLGVANKHLKSANTNLTARGLELRQSTLLAQARLAARRSEQLMSSGDQTYQLGVLLAAEAVRHACASSAIDPAATTNADQNYPNPGCTQSGLDLDGSVANRALAALANAGGRFVTGRLAGSNSPHLVAWSFDGHRFATFSSAQSSRPEVVQVWNADGSLAATATADDGLTADSALSGDGNVLALTSNASNASVTAWSVGDRRPASGRVDGRRPALSANGTSMAWLPRRQARAVNISYGGATHTVSLPSVPADVAISADGSLVTVLVHRSGDDYSLIPIDAASGKVGASRDVGNFATVNGSFWNNPPKVSPKETADPPALWFDPNGSTVWVYNNERHVGVQVVRSAAAPSARVAKVRAVPGALGGYSGLSTLVTSTPDGRTAVLFDSAPVPPTYQVWTLSTGWTTPGVVPLELCSSDTSCSLSLSPNGSELAVSSLSALQIIDVQSPASTSSAAIANRGVFPRGSTVVAGPAGGTALSWSERSIVLVDSVNHSQHPVAVPLDAADTISAVGFDPRGRRYVAIIGRAGRCPCRAVILDAASGNVIGNVNLGATALDRIADERPVGVALNDAGDVVAVTFDDNRDASGTHRPALATYAAQTGQPLQAVENGNLGLGTQLVSVPAFRPDSDALALVATTGTSREVGGVLLDARTGAIVHTLAMKAGVVTVDSNDYGNDAYALRFSPNGELLGWNTGGSVVIWDVGAAGGRPDVESDVVLTSTSYFDPKALAISDNGQVATVGLDYYTGPPNHDTMSVMTGDELGRYLQPLGIARIVSVAGARIGGQISVAMADTGEIAAVAQDLSASRFFTDTWSASPATLLSQLCASSSRVLSAGEWATYFPGETYDPACPSRQVAPEWDIDASPGATLFAARTVTPACATAQWPLAPQACRRRYMGIVSNSFAVVTRPTYSQANSRLHSSVQTAANASVT